MKRITALILCAVVLTGCNRIKHFFGIDRDDRPPPVATATPTPTPTPSPVPTPSPTAQKCGPAHVNDDHFKPGFFMLLGNQPQSTFQLIANNPKWIGVKRIYPWKAIHTADNTYDFSAIDSDLAILDGMGKKLWIQLQVVQFGPWKPNIPAFMFKDPKFGGQLPYYGVYERTAAHGGWYPVYWQSEVLKQHIKLYQALGARYNDHPAVEGISLDETALQHGPAWSGYSPAVAEQAFKSLAAAARRAFPNKVVMQHINFAPWDLSAFADWLAANGIGIGGPDVFLTNNKLINEVYPLYRQHHDQVATGPDVQHPDYEKTNPATGKFFTPAELLAGAIEHTNPWYLMWDKREPYFSNEVLPLIRHAPLPPAAKQFYACRGAT